MPDTEGAGSTITELPDGWVRKTQKRSAKRAKHGYERNHPTIQYSLQSWSHHHLTPENGYILLFTPEVRGSTDTSGKGSSSYEMRQVDTSKEPWFLEGVPPALFEEVRRFEKDFTKGTGYTLYDVEFYPQSDGRVVLLDFDQCFVAAAK